MTDIDSCPSRSWFASDEEDTAAEQAALAAYCGRGLVDRSSDRSSPVGIRKKEEKEQSVLFPGADAVRVSQYEEALGSTTGDPLLSFTARGQRRS